MYLLDLYRRVGVLSSKNKFPGTHIILGYYSFMKAREINDFSLAFSLYNMNSHDRNEDSFTRFTMALFSVEGDNATDNDVLCENNRNLLKEIEEDKRTEPTFYMVTSLKLNNSHFIKKCEKDGKTSGIVLLKKIKESLQKCISDSTLQQKDDSFVFQIYGNLGFYDITVVSASSSLDTLLSLPNMFRDIIENGLPVFMHSTSFIAFSSNINTENIIPVHNKKNDVSINLSVYGATTYKMIKYLKDILPNTPHTPSRINGDYDINIQCKLTLKELVSLFIGKSSENSNKYFYDEEFTGMFRSANTYIMDLDQSFSQEIPEDEMPKIAGFDYEHAKVLSSNLQYAYRDIVNDMPVPIRQTLENCMHSVTILLLDDLRYFTAVKTAKILLVALNNIKDIRKDPLRTENIIYDITTKCLYAISQIIPSVVQTDCYSLDRATTSDMPGSMSKLIFSYEYFIEDVFKRINKPLLNESKNEDVDLFLTIGNSAELNSAHYFYDAYSSSNKFSLINFNLPNTASLSLKKILPYMFHEAGHYVNVLSTKYNRNRCFDFLMKNYITLLLYQYLMKKSKNDKNKDEDPNAVFDKHKDIINCLFDIESLENADSITLSRFCYEWRRISFENLNEFGTSKRLDKMAVYDAVNYFGQNVILNVSNAMKDVIKESRADYMMIVLGGYSLKDYLSIMQQYFNDNKRSALYDINFHFRFTTIIGFYYKKYLVCQKLENIPVTSFEEWINERIKNDDCGFLKDLKSKVIENRRLLVPLIEYLYELDGNIQQAFPLQLNSAFTAKELFDGEVTLEQELVFHMNNWYNCLCELGRVEE